MAKQPAKEVKKRAPKTISEGKKDGRPSKYKEEYNDMAYKFCLLGADDERIADLFQVEVSTLNNWKLEYPNFLESLSRGKDLADAEIAHSLYHRAKGYEHPEVDIKMFAGEIIKTDLIKHYPPDTSAATIWLKNRQAKLWRDKQEIENSGSISVTVSKEVAKEISKALEDKY